MKSNFVILRYNFLRETWEGVFHTDNKKYAFVKYRQLRYNFPYFNYILREEVILNDKC